MEHEYVTSIIRLFAAILAGGLIGLERTFHGRPAGFRTHALVCAASSLLMLLTVFQWQLLKSAPIDTIRVDPTRMAQGIMTGIGFLGAGVIIKESLSVRGLTTAASIWLTASIGIVIGMGLYFEAVISTLMALGVLIIFRRIEDYIPALQYAQLVIRFARHDYMQEGELRNVIKTHEINCFRLSYHLKNEGKLFQYQMTLKTNDTENYKKLSETLNGIDKIIEFSINPTGE
ncbi:MAG: MgtC/SapB family protein [Gammaproteobacteria bacterium]